MKILKIILLSSVILFTAVSCKNDTKKNEIYVPDAVIKKTALLKESVLSQLQEQDPFKIKTAQLFLDNLKYQKNVKGLRYSSYKDIINKYADNKDTMVAKINRIKNQLAADPEDYEVLSVDENRLVTNINETYNTYLKTSWKDKISFDTYCQYLLPYKVYKEPLESNWRKTLKSRFLKENDSSIFQSDMSVAVKKIHAWLYPKKKGFEVLFGKKNLNIPDFTADILDKLKAGSCHEITTLGVAYMRAMGIPATIDFTPNYLNISSGHEWCVAILDSKQHIPFDITYEKTNKIKDDYFIFSKVYRNTVQPNPKSHFVQRGYCNFLPELFNNPFVEDVTQLYTHTANITIPIARKVSSKSQFCYLGVFNRLMQSWNLVSWGKIENGQAIFKNIGTGGVYLPVVVETDGSTIVNSPFILNKNGKIKFLSPQTSTLETIKINRKFYSNPDKEGQKIRMIGGIFQGADNLEFKNPVTLYTIKKNPGDYFNDIELPENLTKNFRYVRYLSPKNSFGNVGEIEFYETVNASPLKGRKIGTEGSWADNLKNTKEAVFDSNVLTYFDSKIADYSWVGLDLSTQRKINKIRFIARNDMNCVQPGDIYELFYWQDGWKSLGQEKAKSIYLIYKNVPKNAVLWLRNLTEGVEERIFTYENGRQVWW
jgi:hypothetical protein